MAVSGSHPDVRRPQLPVTQAIAERWGDLSGQRQQMGRPLGMADGLIAATAIEHGLILITRNVKDFEGIELTILDPWEI
jgi:toxin FitB